MLRAEAGRYFDERRNGEENRIRLENGDYIRTVKHGESFRSALDLPEEDFSLARFLHCWMTGDRSKLSREERAVYSQGTNAAGGYTLSPSQSAQLIDLAVANIIAVAAGCTIVPMTTETLRLGVVESDPVSYWTAENASITESEGTFGGVELRARALASFSKASVEVLRNSAIMENAITGSIARSSALGVDLAVLSGSGAGEEPTGLLNSSQVTAASATGAWTWDKLFSAMGDLWAINVNPTSLCMAPALREFISKMKDGEGLPLQQPADIAALGKYTSTQITSNDSNGVAYVGDFSNVLIGVRSQVEIEMSPFGGSDTFQRKQVAIRGLLFGDVCVARAGDIIRMEGITGL